MSEKPRQTIDDVSFEDDPKRYCQLAYEESSEYNELLNSTAVKDRAFFDGTDEKLKERKLDPRVKRSALYVHETRSAIETRYSAVQDRVEEDPSLLFRITLKEGYDTDEELQEKVAQKEEILNEQLRKSDFIDDHFRKLFMASEMQPLSAVKVNYHREYAWIPDKKSILGMGGDALKRVLSLMIRKRQTPRVEWTSMVYDVKDEQPMVEWLEFDEFLWDPQGTSLKTCQYIIHRKWMSRNDILDMEKEFNLNSKEVSRMLEEKGGDAEQHKESMAEQVDSTEDISSPAKFMKDGKFLIAETWVRTYDDQGRKILKVCVMGNNNYMLSNEVFPFKHIEDPPFEIRVAWAKLGKMEGTSSISLAKPCQRIYNDVNNMIMDSASYSMFSPIIKEKGTKIEGNPTYSLGAVWNVDNIDGIKTFEIKVPPIEQLYMLLEVYSSKIKQILNAPDVSQGIQDNDEQEKATKTRLRVQGHNRRLRPLFKSVEQNLVNIAWLFVKMNQLNDPSWIMPIEITIPCLSGVYTPDEELSQAMALYESAKENPLYQGPLGQAKLREIWINVLTKARIEDIDKYCVTEEELEMQLQINELIAAITAQNEEQQQIPNKENKNASMAAV